MKMLTVRRSTWRTAMLPLAMLALTLAVPAPAAAAPAAAAPTQAEISAGLAQFMASLPKSGLSGINQATQGLQPTGNGRSTQLVITCTGRSIIKTVGIQGFNYAISEATTDCPVPIDWVVAQTWLYKLSSLDMWEEITPGAPDAHPGMFARSVTFESACSADPSLYAAVGFHYIRLGQAWAQGWTFNPSASKCSLQM